MRLIFIRHAEPDYEHNSLTKKGFQEAELLSNRIKNWDVTKFYTSPYGRAVKTGEPSLDKLKQTATVCDWLHEFDYFVDKKEHPLGNIIPWDFSPEFINDNPILLDNEHWFEHPIMQSGDVGKHWQYVYEEFDKLLSGYGYTRNGLFYNSPPGHIPSDHYMSYEGNSLELAKNCQADETNLVFFCHLGVMMFLMAHILNISPVVLTHSFFVPPSSVTILCAEERNPGSAYFRCQTVGDTSHLLRANEPVSYYGFFTSPFQG